MDFRMIKTERLLLPRLFKQPENSEIVTLSHSIAKHGLLVPITVREIAHTDKYEIVSGIKRFLACKLIENTTIPSYIIETSVDLARFIIERNENKNVFDKAEELRLLFLNENIEPQEITQSIGYSEKELFSLLKLTKLNDFEKEIIHRNGISQETASEIASFDDPKTRTELLSEVIRLRLKEHEVQILCENERLGKRKHNKAKIHRTPKFKDLRLFDNTITRAITTLKDAGIKANLISEQKNGGKEYKIRIES